MPIEPTNIIQLIWWYFMNTYEKKTYDIKQSINTLVQKIQIKPDNIKNYYKLGELLKSIGWFEDAKKCYVRILQKFPTDVDTLFDIAFACQNLGHETDAIKWYEKLFEIDPMHAQAHTNMGHIYRIQGIIEKASHHFKIARLQLKHDGLEILNHFSLPVIYQSREEILFYRKRLTDYATSTQANLTDPFKQVGITQFLLAYHGLDDTFIQKAVADFYYRSCPTLGYSSPFLNQTNNNKRIAIGFATTYFLDLHPVGKVFQGLIKYLNRNIFRVILFHPSGKQPVLSKLHQDFKDEIKYLPRDLSQCREIIANEKLDILFYPEIGMEPLIYFLAFSRLAKVQCVGWGHPVTSGIKNIDYYISTSDMEPENGLLHYTEKLVMLKTFITCFDQSQKRMAHLKRTDFNIPDGHWYVCPQNIQKLHPDIDRLFLEILKNDPKGWLILFEGKYPILTQQLMNRMRKNISKLLDRVIFIKSMKIEKFLQFLYLCDAVLDVPYFSSGTTTLEAISAGIPIVTLPGKFFRNRLAYGCFKRINVLDTVAKSPDQYILLANQLASNDDFRMHVSKKILLNNYLIFDNHDVVRAYEQFFIHICQ